METMTKYLGAAQFEIEARGHKIYCDQPAENKGFDEGMTPPELMLGSLGACAGYYAAEYLNARRLPTNGLAVKVAAEKAKAPARLASFQIDVYLPEGVEQQHREGVLRAVKACLIHNTLLHRPDVYVGIDSPNRVPMAA
jgi:uncharacterized OsmC-like protein